MKNIIQRFSLLIAIMLMSVFAQAQRSAINTFYAKYKNQVDVVSFNIPGILVRLGGSVAKWEVEDEMERAAIELTKDIRNVRVLTGEGLFISKSEIKQLIRDLREEGFEELMTVRSEDADVNIIIREQNGLIRNVLLVAEDNQEFTLVSLKTRITLDQLSYFVNQAIE